MSQLELKRISRDIIDHAEKAMVPDKALPKVIDDYFIQRLKQDEMEHASVNSRLYDGLRKLVHAELVPLYEKFRVETSRSRERKQKRKLWQYVVGTVGVCMCLELLITRGRSLMPQVLLPTAILYSFIGFIIYVASQYIDDLNLARARSRLERSLEQIQTHVETDIQYDDRRELLNEDILHAEALEILTHYEKPDAFWCDYRKIRELDPTSPNQLSSINVPAFEKFLKFHTTGHHSALARQQRFNRLFVEAHEIFISRDRERYVLDNLKT